MARHLHLRHHKVHTALPLSFLAATSDATHPGAPVEVKPSPHGGLTLEVTSAPEVSEVALDYRIVRGRDVLRADRQALAFSGKLDDEGRKIWNLLSMPVPRDADVRFTLRYKRGRRTRVDDNDGAGYTVHVD